MRINLNTSLKTYSLEEINKEKFILSFSDIKYDYSIPYDKVPTEVTVKGNVSIVKHRWPVKSQTLFPVRDNIYTNPDTLHLNYLEYLEKCWANHYGVFLSPDIIWYTLLCEIAQLVAKEPNKYRELFSDSAEKQEISVYSDDLEIIPLESIIAELRERVPAGFTDLFMDDFSTTEFRSHSAKCAAFADIVSPYYSYSMLCCGIPFVEVEGTEEDWNNLWDRYKYISDKLNIDMSYRGKVLYVLTMICSSFSNKNDEFWKNILVVERCGSGSEIELYGWFTDLFRIQPNGVRKSCNFSTHVSTVKYKHLNTGKHYQMKQGLFYAVRDDDLLVPDFSYIVMENK